VKHSSGGRKYGGGSMWRRRNRPRLTHFAGLLLVGRQDFRVRATRPRVCEGMPGFAHRASKGQIDASPRGNFVFAQKAARRFGELCKDEPVTRPTRSAIYGVGVETGSAGRMADSRSSAPMALSVTLITGAAERYYNTNPLTWVLAVLLVLILAFICWPPPPGDVDTGPGCNGT